MSVHRQELVIVGGGMAAGRLVEQLIARSCPHRITLIGAEGMVGYNRVRLPEVLAGRCPPEALAVRDPDWFADQGVRLVTGDPVEAIDRADRSVTSRSGTRFPFDHLVLATGSSVPVPRVPGIDLSGVGVFRNRDDALRLQDSARSGGIVTIVGGGLLGLETAESFLDAGARVRVLHRRDRLMNRQLDARGAAILAAFLAGRGIDCVLDAQVEALLGRDRVEAVRLTDGRELPTSAVVFATGSIPEDGLAVAAGLPCDGGILVDDRLATGVPGLHALGECARVGGRHYALVAPVHRQAEVLAANLCGGDARFEPPPPATRLKVSGIEVFSAGRVDAAGRDVADIRVDDPDGGVHRRLWFVGEQLVGAVLVGDATGARRIEGTIGRPVASRAERNALVFGLDTATDSGIDAGMGVAA